MPAIVIETVEDLNRRSFGAAAIERRQHETDFSARHCQYFA